MLVPAGIAHLHHLWENHIVRGLPLRTAVAMALCQGAYTTLFGQFATLLLLRTGTLAAPVAAHAFCNWQGLPDFPRLLRESTATRVLLFGGTAAFSVALREFCRRWLVAS